MPIYHFLQNGAPQTIQSLFTFLFFLQNGAPKTIQSPFTIFYRMELLRLSNPHLPFFTEWSSSDHSIPIYHFLQSGAPQTIQCPFTIFYRMELLRPSNPHLPFFYRMELLRLSNPHLPFFTEWSSSDHPMPIYNEYRPCYVETNQYFDTPYTVALYIVRPQNRFLMYTCALKSAPSP